MPIIINEPVIAANSQEVKFDELHILGGANGSLSAIVSFSRKSETGELLSPLAIEYSGDDFNEFWENFNSGTFLYEELARIRSLPSPEDDSTEEDFLNE